LETGAFAKRLAANGGVGFSPQARLAILLRFRSRRTYPRIFSGLAVPCVARARIDALSGRAAQ
jgi:hypothetical protein